MRRLLLTLLLAPLVHAQASAHPAWTTPLPPFQIADNLYYVGCPNLCLLRVFFCTSHSPLKHSYL